VAALKAKLWCRSPFIASDGSHLAFKFAPVGQTPGLLCRSNFDLKAIAEKHTWP
jgi:hypothetical protein